MQVSSDHATQHAGGNINSHNSLNFQGESVHHHTHHHTGQLAGTQATAALLRCPLPSPKFVGRNVELSRLKEFFSSKSSGHKAFTLMGMGGCGKSQIASRLTHEHVLGEKMYDPQMVFFVDATTVSTLQESYASIAKCKGVGSSWKDAVLWLSNTTQPSFTLIDNADSPSLELSDYIPRSTNAHILITTRLHDAGRLYASTEDAFIDLDALPFADAEELLIRTMGLKHDRLEDVEQLVQVLHCYALAIAQAGACIAHLRLAVSQYLERFRRMGTNFMDGTNDGVGSKALYGYSKVVRDSWRLSYEELPAQSRELFNLCAHLHHTGITQMLFQKASNAVQTYEPTVPFSPSEDDAFLALKEVLRTCQGADGFFDDITFQRCITPILDLSLMRQDPETRIYSIHPLILDALKRIVSDHLPTSLLLMLAIYADTNDRPFLCHLLPHVDNVVDRFNTGTVEIMPVLGRSHPDLAVTFSYVYKENACWDRAESLQRACVAQRTIALGSVHKNTLRASTSLSFTLNQSGQFVAAEILGRTVLADWMREYGEDSADALRASDILASALFELGRYTEAETMQLDVMSRRKLLLGDDHPDTVRTMSSLANTLSRLGQHKEAERMRLDVLSRRKRLLGEDHPDTVWTMSSLANTLSNLGQYKEAERMQLDVLSRRKRLLGENHLDTVWALQSLASTLFRFRRYPEAETMERDALSRHKRLLGEDHPETIWTMNNLADTLSHLGQHEEAERMQREALARRRRVLGEDHPYTLQSVEQLTKISARREASEQALQKGTELLPEPSVQPVAGYEEATLSLVEETKPDPLISLSPDTGPPSPSSITDPPLAGAAKDALSTPKPSGHKSRNLIKKLKSRFGCH